MSGKFTLRRSGTLRMTMAVKHHVGSREIAIVLLTKGAEGTDMSRAEVLDLVREVAQERGGQGLMPDCGVDFEDGYEDEWVTHAKIPPVYRDQLKPNARFANPEETR